MCKPLGVSLHAVSNGAAPPPAVLPAAAVLPAYSTLPLMPGFLGAPHPSAAAPNPVTHAHTAAADWNTYYYVSKEQSMIQTLKEWRHETHFFVSILLGFFSPSFSFLFEIMTHSSWAK